ncbi:MAG: galactose mutarotase [Verrucomicrobia bacterium]|nr:galactose mutarotase [Verrucomicrobiota bacterium]
MSVRRALFFAILTAGASAAPSTLRMQPFGTLPAGQPARLYTLENSRGIRADITDYGGIVVRLLVPDRNGVLDDVVLGFDSVEKYAAGSPYFGCVVGRVGNRIAGGKFSLDGKTYTLVTNNEPGGKPCHLHGGRVGFDKALWNVTPRPGPEPALVLRHLSPAGDEGYPGALTVEVTYMLTADDALRIDYSATTDAATPVNLTNHSYFNLRGEGRGDVLGHELTLRAARYTPVDAGLIPTGKIAPVAGTPLDFTAPHPIGARIGTSTEQLTFAGGYDHNFVLDSQGGTLALAATVHEPATGRVMTMWTTEPGVQFYTGNFLDGKLTGKRGAPYPFRGGFCLETQHYPDSPNQPAFPSTILRPGRTYRSTTLYSFSAK